MTSVSNYSLEQLNALPADAALTALLGCCSSSTWAAAVATARPYHSISELLIQSDRAVSLLDTADLSAALAAHPRIGDRRLLTSGQPSSAVNSGVQAGRLDEPHSVSVGMPAGQGVAQPAGPAGIRPTPQNNDPATNENNENTWSSQEQAGVGAADEATLRALADGNASYEQRFGHIYLACATGRSGAELLAFLKERLENDPEREWRVVAAELAKINRIRLGKLIGGNA